ncbi:glucose-1-phosphate adenylyltransferase [Breznakia sp. PF5-3]|uniref:glucose-1-phosphate adenylyltransferase n=1 Tax=unclassified Breznakia TaxID=2623764 RepID=UPI002405B787|nr:MULTISPECIES: glucose-1-phosphate adenylyltransferase [unclassified Breznakia]MDF9824575.1 glucose-1-phosphate adenylyltransferase [Breznakia sp. PM6-1]MDF9835465.1 glucose-1-phosphate adenylyltransferase [Breznakia sp. PF5-3]MDF9837875.1 glucose-1-phosphate adenylyltransferase [Breznakia sp. PFB2-8]MDF9859832.1 glucose-1-phosphate adenylyltransferase [Breznakia sp. PH5-24]
MRANNMIAMILAGGRGSRLHALTSKVAKPAVYFGGKYRIIDFPLSNCANSNIDIVGVLTQYESVLLNAYASQGIRWGLDTFDSGVYVLPPREKADSDLDVYRGTADAITQNIDFLDQYNPEYILVLSGDHIYKMNYEEMLRYHVSEKADVTIAVLEVDMKEASRFGIMNTDSEGRIVEFEEKPEHPKSNLASMGIYIFNWKLLRKELIEDAKDETSSHDFGKDIIPKLLEEHKRLYAFTYSGYWKDVGTIDSLWEANMDLLYKNEEINLNDSSWKIYTEDTSSLPQYISDTGEVIHSYINQGCVINGKVERSVLFTDVKIGKGAKVRDAVLMPGAEVGENAIVDRCIVAENVHIGAGCKAGDAKGEHIELISKNVKKERPKKTKVKRGNR